MPEIDQKTLERAIKALKIDVPVYTATKLKDGSIQIITRNGIQVWKPPAKKKPAKKKPGGSSK